MKLDLASFARAGVIALGVLGAYTAPSLAGPAALAGGADIAPSAANLALTPLLIQSTEPDYRGGNEGWWDGNGDEQWRRRRYWRHPNTVVGPNTNWIPHERRYPRHYRPRHRSGIYFNFDLTPRYVEPRYVYPRRVMRGLSQAHVNWCYNRYRSYRAWDNTFQPYNGPRQQCWSPYS